MRLASSAENVNVSTLRATSPIAYFPASPAPRAISAAISFFRASTISAARRRIADRLCAGVADQAGKASRARATARPTAAASATGTSPIVSPEYLSRTCSVVAVAVSDIAAVRNGRSPSYIHQPVPARSAIVVQPEEIERPRHGVIHEVGDRPRPMVEGGQRRRDDHAHLRRLRR